MKSYKEIHIHFHQIHFFVIFFSKGYQKILFLVDLFYIVFRIYLNSCITISYITLKPINTPDVVAADFGIAINPIPVTDFLIELDAVVIKTIVSNYFNIVVNVLYFPCFFLDLLFYLWSK